MFTKGTVVCNELKTKLLLTAVVCNSKLFQPDHRLLIGDLGATKRQGNVFVSCCSLCLSNSPQQITSLLKQDTFTLESTEVKKKYDFFAGQHQS